MHSFSTIHFHCNFLVCIQWKVAARRSLLSRARNLDHVINDLQTRVKSHCAHLRQDVRNAKARAAEILAREELEHMRDIDAYERECLSRAVASAESDQASINGIFEEKRAFINEHAQLADDRSLQHAIDDLIKLKETVGKREGDIMAAVYGNQQATFRDYTDMRGVSLGELAFTTIQYPFAKLDLTKMRPLNISPSLTTHDTSVWPLSNGHYITTHSPSTYQDIVPDAVTRLCSYDPSGRMVHSIELDADSVIGDVVNDQLVVSDYSLIEGSTLWVFNSSLNCLLEKSVSSFYLKICCNSTYVFCVASENDELVVDVRRLDTLVKVFRLHVASFHDIKSIFANESYACTLSYDRAGHNFLSYFDLRGSVDSWTFAANRVLPVSNDDYLIYADCIACFKGRQLTWLDKSGNASSTITQIVIQQGAQINRVTQSGKSVLFYLDDNRVFVTA